MEQLLVPSEATVIPGKRVLVIAPHPDDEVFGCGGAILRHVAQGARVHVRIWTSGGYGVAPGTKAEYVATRQRESTVAAQVLGYGVPEFGSGEDRNVIYGEQLVGEVLALIAQHEADLVYAPSVMEMHPDHRALGMAAVEAVRRAGKDLRLAQYEIGVPLRPNLLLDITDVAARKLEAMRCFASQLEKQRYDLDVAALNRYRSFTLPPEVTAAEAYLVATAEELQGDPLGLYQSEATKQGALGLPLDSRDLPLVSIIVRSMDRRSLALALDSVALQTYQNIEVVVINATGRAHRPLGAFCGRFPLRTIEPGKGLERAVAANCGLDSARGEFLIFLDDDDLMLPHHIAKLVQEFRNGETAVAAYAGVIGTNREGREIERFDYAFDPVRLRMGNYIPIHALLFRRAAVTRGARFDESLPVCEDWDFWLQLLEQGTFRHAPGIGAIYHMQNDGGSGVWVNMDESRRVVLRLLRKWLQRWKDREVWGLMEYARYRFLYDELDAKRLQHEAAYEERIAALEEFVALKNELALKKDAAIAQALAQKDSVIASKDALIAEKDAAYRERDAFIRMLGEQMEDQRYYVERLKESLQDQIHALKDREAYIARLLGSTSWRMTAPLRRALQLVRGTPDLQPPASAPPHVVPLGAPSQELQQEPVAPELQAADAPEPSATPVSEAPPQAPAATPAVPSMDEDKEEGKKHVYDYAIDPHAQNAPNFVRELVGSGKRVLEIGCGPGSITRAMTAAGCRLTGIEVDPVAIELARPHCEAIFQQDLNAADWPQVLGATEPFDTVVAADVLEHLYDPWRTLKQMAALMREDGSIVVSVPHAGHAAYAASFIGGDVAYSESGLLDRTHIRFFGLKNLEDMFAAAQLKIVEVRFVVIAPEQTELAAHWNQLNEFVRAALRLSKYSSIYQVVVRAVSIGQPGTPVSLLNPD